jgi:uncharacterized protein (TIGR02147 family)
MISVFQFLDYRAFLLAHFEERKAESSWYSFKIMGDSVGLDQSQVFRILQGQLHVSKAALPRFLTYLNFQGPAAEYFTLLVAFGRARKDAEARTLFAEILSLRGSRSSTLEDGQLNLYSEWHHSVVRALLGALSITDNYQLLGQSLSPPITASQAKKSVELLRRLKLVERDNNGVWKLTDKNITTGSTYQSLIVRQYQAHSLRLAEESLDRHPKELRDINVINMAVDAQAFQDCVAILKHARSQIRDRIEKVNNPDRILRLASALFPVAMTGKVEQP